MSKISVNMPEGLHADLKLWASLEGRPVSDLAGYLLETCIRLHFESKYGAALKAAIAAAEKADLTA
jgi:hypothetical protein